MVDELYLLDALSPGEGDILVKVVATYVVAYESFARYWGVEGPSVDDGSEVIGKHVRLVFWKYVSVDIFKYALEERA